MRISVQLIDGSTDKHIWAKNYEKEVKDILALQSEVAQAIAQEINLTLTPREKSRLASARTIDPQAHELYLKGRYFWNKRTEAGLKKAADYFTQAILIDSSYALAYSGLADCYNLLPFYGFWRPRDAYPKARAAALRAQMIDSTLAEASTSLAYYLFSYEWNWNAAEQEFKRAIQLNPRYSTAHHWYGLFLAHMKKFDESIRELQTARELDPLSLIINTGCGDVLYRARRFDEAIQQYRKTIDMDSTFANAHVMLGATYLQKHMYQEALDELSKAEALPLLTGPLVALGRRKEAIAVISRMMDESRHRYVRNDMIAAAYLGIGDFKKALDFLEKGAEEHDPQLAEDLNVDPSWDPLRTDPRFIALVRKMGLEK